MSKTKIAWSEYSWNPVIGCTKCSPGCKNCYAERMAKRLYWMGMGHLSDFPEYMKFEEGWKNGHIELCEHRLDQPLHWKKPRRIFVCSMSDLFHPAVPFEFIDKVFRTIRRCPQHIFQVLTKRPERMKEYISGLADWLNGIQLVCMLNFEKWPLSNVHLGVSISTQAEANEKIPILLQIPAAIRGLSIEPMLEGIDITNKGIKNGYSQPTTFDHNGMGIEWTDPGDNYVNLDWAVVGVESGPKRRPCKTEWVRDIVKQCKAAGVPVFVKQLSINGKVEHNMEKFPKDLQFQEYP